MVSTTFTYLSRLRRDNYVDVVVDTIHVADAVADTDDTYGAYAAAENNTFNNANASINNANKRIIPTLLFDPLESVHKWNA